MRRRSPRIWIGISAFALIAGAADGRLPIPDLSGKVSLSAWAAAGEEQGGVGGGDHHKAIESDDAIVAQLLLMRGHLLAARTLVTKGEAEQAKPHLRRPLEELFLPVHEPLEDRATELEEALEAALAEAHAAAEGDPAPMREAAEAALSAIDRALAAVAAGRLSDPAFAAAVLERLLQTVAAEYEEAVEDGRFVNLVAYQDAWGLFQVAQEIWSKLAAEGGRAEVIQAVAAKLGELDATFPEVSPPTQPAIDVDRLRATVSAIALDIAALRS